MSKPTPTGPIPIGPVQIVWFKRDLRLIDHAPLCAAAARGPVLPLVVVEPAYWALPDTAHRHYMFWSGCVHELAAAIAEQGGTLLVRLGTIEAALEALLDAVGPFTLHAHAETGNGWTYARDRAVRRWMRARGLMFTEYQSGGVLRGPSLNRDRWSRQWDQAMAAPIPPAPRPRWITLPSDAVPDAARLSLHPDGLTDPQVPGRDAGLATLHGFLHDRGEFYTRAMSSPAAGARACSRISPYLAYGALSMREVTKAAWTRQASIDPASAWGAALRSFIARLHWHCHFIQKLEAEPAAETRPFARVYEGVRPAGDPVMLEAWGTGHTGYPFVDAAMRFLIAHGWINFRMRAMLMSFASYDLFLPWQQSGQILARRFTDYEPGIHWPQCQMQSGETGINTVRVYSPVKQGHDQDPTGSFVRRWVPELAAISGALVHEPWLLDAAERARLCPDYPAPIIEHGRATAHAKAMLFARRKTEEAQREADGVQQRHGSRRRATTARARKRPAAIPAQPSFDL